MIDYKAEREKFQREQETWSFCLLFSPKMKGGQKLPHQVAAAETQLLGYIFPKPTSDIQAANFWVLGRLKPSFLGFWASVGFGWCKNGRACIYGSTYLQNT